ncbi:MAG: hypothetical protein HZA77_15715 [Candidatus Schekmanbacteria bacterium]|nr:hypothetical protein [Candidatus Schekmanbacteria bacterium]
MNSNIKNILFTLTIVLLSFQANAMSCWSGSGMGSGRGESYNDNMRNMQNYSQSRKSQSNTESFFTDLQYELNLSEKQMKALNEIRAEYEKEKSSKESDIYKIDESLNDMETRKDVNMSEVKKKVDELERLQKDLKWEYIETVEKAKKVLTDEQINLLSLRSTNTNSTTMNSGMPGMNENMGSHMDNGM